MRIIDLGLVPYAEAVSIQERTLNAVVAGAEETLFLLEHPSVITVGRQGGLENLHAAPELLKARGVELARTARGGNITCHFPGQLVAYPIFRVERRKGGLKTFFHDMEEAVIRTAARFGVRSGREQGRTGVWTAGRKLCSMGIGVRRFVTWHGLALNVGSDLSLFSLITLCGLAGAEPTSLSIETKRPIAMKDVKDALAQEFLGLFAHTAVA